MFPDSPLKVYSCGMSSSAPKALITRTISPQSFVIWRPKYMSRRLLTCIVFISWVNIDKCNLDLLRKKELRVLCYCITAKDILEVRQSYSQYNFVPIGSSLDAVIWYVSLYSASKASRIILLSSDVCTDLTVHIPKTALIVWWIWLGTNH